MGKPVSLLGLDQPAPRAQISELADQFGELNRIALRILEGLSIGQTVAGNPQALSIILAILGRSLEERFSDARIRAMAAESARRLARRHEQQFLRAVSRLVGRRIEGSDSAPEGTGPLIEATRRTRGAVLVVRTNPAPEALATVFIEENVRRIRTLRDGIPRAVGDAVGREVLLGEGDSDELAAALLAEWEARGVPSAIPTRRRTRAGLPVMVSARAQAETIAVDQLTTLNAQLNQARQERAGITKFRWRWAPGRKGGVRDDHRAVNGQTFTWQAGAPVTGNLPGHATHCMCHAQAVTDAEEILASRMFIAPEQTDIESTPAA